MDLVTQGLLGAVAGQSVSKPGHARIAALAGSAAALLADADVLIRSGQDALLTLEFHRHFTHALLFIPVGAMIAAALLWLPMRHHLSFRQLYAYTFIGYATAGLLDACTSYGTHLLWPFSAAPVAWSIIAIVDPLFSLILLAGLIAAWHLRQRRAAWFALALAVAYLVFGAVQHHRALQVAEALAVERGMVPSRVLVKPTMGNLVLWRALAVSGNHVQADAIRVGLFAGNRIYPGESARLVDPHTWKGLPKSSAAYRDLQRFHAFSQQLLVEHAEKPNWIGDGRYSMLPDSLVPIWGIRLDPSKPEQPAAFEVDRAFPKETRHKFIDMLWGRDLSDAGRPG